MVCGAGFWAKTTADVQRAATRTTDLSIKEAEQTRVADFSGTWQSGQGLQGGCKKAGITKKGGPAPPGNRRRTARVRRRAAPGPRKERRAANGPAPPWDNGAPDRKRAYALLTRRLLVTLNTPETPLARMKAMLLSVSLFTTPSRVTSPRFTMMRIEGCVPRP